MGSKHPEFSQTLAQSQSDQRDFYPEVTSLSLIRMNNLNRTDRPTVIVADDDEEVRVLLAQVLETYGYEVHVVPDGEQAWKRLNEAPVDAILMDIIMPGIDGYDLCRKIKKQPKFEHIPVLLISGLQSQVMRLRGIEAGAEDLFPKPVDFNEIVLRLKSSIAAKKRFEKASARARTSESLEQQIGI